MKENKLKSWRDCRGDISERAYKLLSQKNLKINELSKRFQIPAKTLTNTRSDPKRLETIQVERTIKLADYYDFLEFHKTMSSDQLKALKSKINILFSELSHKYKDKPEDKELITQMQKVIIDDPIALMQIFKNINKEDI